MNLHVHVWYLHKRCAFLCVLIACVQFGVKAWRIRWVRCLHVAVFWVPSTLKRALSYMQGPRAEPMGSTSD